MTVVRRSLESVTPASNTPGPGELGLHYPPWMADALCAQTDPELFFPDKGGSSTAAKAICARCPVAAECLDYALADDQSSYVSPFYFGIWGGTTRTERQAIRAALHPTSPTDPTQEETRP